MMTRLQKMFFVYVNCRIKVIERSFGTVYRTGDILRVDDVNHKNKTFTTKCGLLHRQIMWGYKEEGTAWERINED